MPTMPQPPSDLADRVGLLVRALEHDRKRDRAEAVGRALDYGHTQLPEAWRTTIAYLSSRNIIACGRSFTLIERGPRWEERAAALREAEKAGVVS